MLMGRDQMAVLHSFFIKELCKILQLHLATQKDRSLLRFPLKYRYFLPLKTRSKEGRGFCEADSNVLFSGSIFPPSSEAERERTRGVGEDIWGVSTPQCCHLLFGVQSKPIPVEGQPRSHNSPTWSLGCHLWEPWLTGEA